MYTSGQQLTFVRGDGFCGVGWAVGCCYCSKLAHRGTDLFNGIHRVLEGTLTIGIVNLQAASVLLYAAPVVSLCSVARDTMLWLVLFAACLPASAPCTQQGLQQPVAGERYQ